MAKPKHVRWNNGASSATEDLPLLSSSFNHLSYLSSSAHPRHHSSHCLPSPSSAVLAALALIATTPAVAGGPLPVQTAPPSFLCPFIERDNVDPTSIVTPRIAIQATSSPVPTSTSLQNSKREPVADRYIKGADKVWRKTNVWTLYGSTCCSSPTSTPISQSAPTTSSSSSTSMPTSTPTAVQFDTSSLPAGWDRTTSGSSAESTIILALATILAGLICALILGCVIWRKRRRKSMDTERTISHKLHADDSSDYDEREKDAWGKMRGWTKASARWKINVRHSARRRRKKSTANKGTNRPQSPTPNDSREVLAGLSSAVSRLSSSASQEPGASRPETSSDNSNTIVLSPTLPPLTPSPPTYGSPVVPRPSRKLHSVTGDSNATISRGTSEDCSHPSAEDEPLPYLPPSDGHVAMDDKAQLARIHELASSPHNMSNDPDASTMISAPAWHEVEDELDDLCVDLKTSTSTLSHPPLFPSPPAEANNPLGYLDGNPFKYGEEDGIQVSAPIPSPSPSRPPSFEISPSAPPIGDLDLEPSAPTLEDEDDVYEDWHGATPANLASPSFPSSFALPPARGSVTRESALPRYRP